MERRPREAAFFYALIAVRSPVLSEERGNMGLLHRFTQGAAAAFFFNKNPSAVTKRIDPPARGRREILFNR